MEHTQKRASMAVPKAARRLVKGLSDKRSLCFQKFPARLAHLTTLPPLQQASHHLTSVPTLPIAQHPEKRSAALAWSTYGTAHSQRAPVVKQKSFPVRDSTCQPSCQPAQRWTTRLPTVPCKWTAHRLIWKENPPRQRLPKLATGKPLRGIAQRVGKKLSSRPRKLPESAGCRRRAIFQGQPPTHNHQSRCPGQ